MNIPAKTRKLPSAITLICNISYCNFRSGIVFILSYTMKKLVFLGIGVLIILFGFDYCAYGLKMNINPPRVEIFVNAGEEKSGYISVLNYDEDESIHVKAYINDLVYLPDGSNDFLAKETTPWSIASWLKISPTEFDIPAGKEMQMRYIVDVPKGVEGGRYGIVFFEVSPPLGELKDRTGASVNLRIGSIFLITVKGTEKYDAEIQDLVVNQPGQDGTFEISCIIKNKGNVLIRPNGPVKILDSRETEIAELWLNQDKTGVLPGTSRQFSVKYDKGKIVPGNYFTQVVLDYGGDVLLGGQSSFNWELPK